MFNQDGILEALELNDRTKFLIEPVRKTLLQGTMTRVKNDLASAPFSGFAGFVDKSFRQHDYHLGRQNCQTFLRYYFGVPEKDIQSRLNDQPHGQAFERFYFNESQFDATSKKL